jgi:hypothetical protein
MNKQEAVAKACQIIRKRVRFKTARMPLPGNDTFQNDTPLISSCLSSVYVRICLPHVASDDMLPVSA